MVSAAQYNILLTIYIFTNNQPLRTDLHAEVSLSKILNLRIAPDVQLAPCGAATAISKGPAMSRWLIQGVPWPLPMSRTGFGPSKPCNPSGG